MQVTDAYQGFKDGKELYFLDENSSPVKVKSITKEAYSGKIYDVDVPNDVVLVRRRGGGAFWSGNSNNGTVVNATYTPSGKFGGAYSFDGGGDYIQSSPSSISTTDYT